MNTELLLQFIWKYKLFDSSDLRTTGGEKVAITRCGTENRDAGPDFLNAKIKIGDTLWAGNVELHLKSSGWKAHNHQKDAAYKNVVLHVVYEDDGERAIDNSGQSIPTLVLKDKINPATIERYEQLMKNKTWVACESFLPEIDSFVLSQWKERLLIERLEQKVSFIHELLAKTGNDWEQVMFEMLARYFGASVNKEAFEQLAKTVSVKIWSHYVGDLHKIEALLFGQAGYLEEDLEEDYPKKLRQEYKYLKRLHQLPSPKKSMFKLLRLRPANFPTLRLAQLAAFLNKDAKLFSKLLAVKTAQEVSQLFETTPSDYWKTHYLFDKTSDGVKWRLGKQSKNTLAINVVAPLLFAYGKYKDDEVFCERALALLQELSRELNQVVKNWEQFIPPVNNAAESQALLHLKQYYCEPFRCLECQIGVSILGKAAKR